MTIEIENLTEFGLVKLINGLPFTVFCLNIGDGLYYVVAPRRKKLKETRSACYLHCLKVSGVDIKALDRAFTYYGYSLKR